MIAPQIMWKGIYRSLYIKIKDCNLESVRAQRINCGKITIDFMWSWAFKCNVMTYVNNF